MNCSTCQTPSDACSWSQNPRAGRGDCCASCEHGPARPPSVQTALDRVADILGALGRWGRLPYATAALEVMGREGGDPWWTEFWRGIYLLVEALDAEETQPQQQNREVSK